MYNIPLLSPQSRAWLASVSHLPPDQVQQHAVNAAKNNLISFPEAVAIKMAADRISQSAPQQQPQSTVMTDLSKQVVSGLYGVPIPQSGQPPPQGLPAPQQAPPMQGAQGPQAGPPAGISGLQLPDSMFTGGAGPQAQGAPKSMAGGGIVAFNGEDDDQLVATPDPGSEFSAFFPNLIPSDQTPLVAGKPEIQYRLQDWLGDKNRNLTGRYFRSFADATETDANNPFKKADAQKTAAQAAAQAADAPPPATDNSLLAAPPPDLGFSASGGSGISFRGSVAPAGLAGLRARIRKMEDANKPPESYDSYLENAQKRAVAMGYDKNSAEYLAALKARGDTTDEDQSKDTRMARASSFFKMAEAASHPGATFLGSAAAGGADYSDRTQKLIDKYRDAHDKLEDRRFAVQQSLSDKKEGRDTAAANRYDQNVKSYNETARQLTAQEVAMMDTETKAQGLMDARSIAAAQLKKGVTDEQMQAKAVWYFERSIDPSVPEATRGRYFDMYQKYNSARSQMAQAGSAFGVAAESSKTKAQTALNANPVYIQYKKTNEDTSKSPQERMDAGKRMRTMELGMQRTYTYGEPGASTENYDHLLPTR